MIINYINNMSYSQIVFWIIIGYIVSIIVGRILLYSAAVLHNWCMMVLWDEEYWYNKGTTIKDIYNDRSIGDNFKSGDEAKFVPLINVIFPLIWISGELSFLCLVIIVLIVRLIIFIFGLLYCLIFRKCLSKLFKPLFNYIDNIDVNSKDTWINKGVTFFEKIKQFILNTRIA
jgi:hypothetical protein